MNREELLKALFEISMEISKEKGYEHYRENRSDCGIWDCKEWTGCETTMSSVLEKEHGKMVEYVFHNGVPEDGSVGVRFRFANPCLNMRYRDERNFVCMASIEFSDGYYDENKEYGHNGEYVLAEVMFWRPGGKELLDILYEKCREKGVPVD